MTEPTGPARLVADVGGTHVRFGLVNAAGRLLGMRSSDCSDHDSLGAAARAYLEAVAADPPPRQAALAVAGPVRGDRIRLTNSAWSFNLPDLRRELVLERLEVLNDFAALAWALPVLRRRDTWEIRLGTPASGQPMAVLGPGTGLGVGLAVSCGASWTAVATEGGHRDLAAQNEREWEILSWLRHRFGRVSVERVLSGPGLVNLYEALCGLDGVEPASLTPRTLVEVAGSAEWPACGEAVRLFCGWLGAVAGDLALTVGARGGVFLAGGILPKMEDRFDRAHFNERFLAKGRMRDYLLPVPVRLIVQPRAALVGAARFLDRPQ